MTLPVLILAPVFASMIEPSVVPPGGPHPSPRRMSRTLRKPRERSAGWVAHSSVHRKMENRRRRAACSAWRRNGPHRGGGTFRSLGGDRGAAAVQGDPIGKPAEALVSSEH